MFTHNLKISAGRTTPEKRERASERPHLREMTEDERERIMLTAHTLYKTLNASRVKVYSSPEMRKEVSQKHEARSDPLTVSHFCSHETVYTITV